MENEVSYLSTGCCVGTAEHLIAHTHLYLYQVTLFFFSLVPFFPFFSAILGISARLGSAQDLQGSSRNTIFSTALCKWKKQSEFSY